MTYITSSLPSLSTSLFLSELSPHNQDKHMHVEKWRCAFIILHNGNMYMYMCKKVFTCKYSKDYNTTFNGACMIGLTFSHPEVHCFPFLSIHINPNPDYLFGILSAFFDFWTSFDFSDCWQSFFGLSNCWPFFVFSDFPWASSLQRYNYLH